MEQKFLLKIILKVRFLTLKQESKINLAKKKVQHHAQVVGELRTINFQN
jgi:hypothetical protein